MLIIISDIHLTDGTCGKSIAPAAFQLFTDRVKELAYNSSASGIDPCLPANNIDILLLGDILDPLHSTLWLDGKADEPGSVRPWTDHGAPEYAAKLGEITRAILKNNAESISILKRMVQTGIMLQSVDNTGKSSGKTGGQPVKVQLHYIVGNHDWYYHLPGEEFDRIRAGIVDAFGLSNTQGPFPHQLEESPELVNLLGHYKVHAHHGDLYDPFNYDKEKGRDASSLGDAFAIEILNRFPVEVAKQLGKDLPEGIVESLRELVNVRPALATPLWVSSQLRLHNISPLLQRKIKDIWNKMSMEFVKLKFVQESHIPFKFDIVDGLEMAIGLADLVSFRTIDNLVLRLRSKFGSDEITFASHALREKAFIDHTAKFIVYGHTHHHEIIPLNSYPNTPFPEIQMYINSGTWHPYYDLAVYKPEDQKFVPYQVLTYVAFFEGDEQHEHRFETWSGAFSE